MPLIYAQMLIPPCYCHACHTLIVYHISCALNLALLRLDLAVRLDGDLVVGLQGGDGIIGDLGTSGALALRSICGGGKRWWAYVKPLIRVNSLTWKHVLVDVR
jgi:hypothetical protein